MPPQLWCVIHELEPTRGVQLPSSWRAAVVRSRSRPSQRGNRALRTCNGIELAAIDRKEAHTPHPLATSSSPKEATSETQFQSTTAPTSPIPTPPRPHQHMTVQACLPRREKRARVMSARRGRPRRDRIPRGQSHTALPITK